MGQSIPRFQEKEMSGFNSSDFVNHDEVHKLLKKYKKTKKYMKSSLYTVKVMDGTETYVKGLLEDEQS
jgi:phosphate starvation-inducible protein PhoH